MRSSDRDGPLICMERRCSRVASFADLGSGYAKLNVGCDILGRGK